MIERAEAIGFEPASIRYRDGARVNTDARDNERARIEDEALAALLFERARAHLPAIGGGPPLRADAQLRVYRYQPGQKFVTHRDGFTSAADAQSRLTYMVYLNDVSEGGETYFPAYATNIRPAAGRALFFQHSLLHEGRPVARGTKYALRTDVLYSITRG